MDYKIGDKVVYPNHGVGVIEQINYGVLNGKTERYFMIRIVSSDLRVMVPQTNAESVGLRSVMRSNDTTKVLGFLERGKLNCHHDWKHRFKENSERMRTGSLLEVAVVLKSLVLPKPQQATFLPREKNAGTRQVLAGERDGDRAKHLRGKSAEAMVFEVVGKSQIAIPGDDQEVRVVFNRSGTACSTC